MSVINACVVGIGRLGSFHAKKYLELDANQVRLVALVDKDPERVLEDFPHIPIFNSVENLLVAEKAGEVPTAQVASIATTTDSHLDVSLALIAAGKHLLVEKPLALHSNDCRKIIAAAEDKKRVLAVGHVERHRAMQVLNNIGKPRFIECHRLAPFSFRSTDIDVILDLMIHDIDLMLSIVKSPLKLVHAAGFPVLTKKIDIANARFEFQDGCIANLTSSRISAMHTRKFRVFSEDSYVSLDLADSTYQKFHKKPNAPNLLESIEGTAGDIEVKDALRSEVGDFVSAVRDKRKPLVTGEDALHAQELAEKVLAEINSRLV